MLYNKIKIRTNILLHFLFVVVTLAFILVGLQYHFSENLAKDAIGRTFRQTADKIALTVQDKDLLAKEVLYQIETHPSIKQDINKSIRFEIIGHFIPTLKRYEKMYAIYLGYGNGDLLEVINMHIDKMIHTHYKAPKNTRWTVIHIFDKDKERIREFIFLDEKMQILSRRSEPSSYRVSDRPWYTQAIASNVAVRSDPYLFSNLQEKGITYSKRLEGSKTVLALDFTLEHMYAMLRSLRFSQSSNIYLYGRDGSIISSSDTPQDEIDTLLQHMIREHQINTVKLVKDPKIDAFVTVIPLSQEQGKETYIGISTGSTEMLSPYREKIYYSLAIALLLLLIFIPLTLYLTDHIVRPIKALMVENEKIKQREFDKVKPIETNIIELIELSDSQLALSSSIQEYQLQQEALLDAFIMLIADAIDAKSAYTGAHCKKVPILATMLAVETDRTNDIPFKDFHFQNDDEWEAFERAAWLHDCGKITTPEYVVDKATKLETIYNRIHEIRTRFEVLWRDVEIGYYERLIGGEEETALKAWKHHEQQALLEDFAFIATCNLGGEHMEGEKIKRLQTIAKRTWLRHFDNRLGLAEEELLRYDTKPQALPITEQLLHDGREHLIERIGFDEEEYRKKGFKMEVPKYLYNRGELYNLSTQKGTLTEEERFKINEHIIMTIRMLEQLPFPDSMKEIPKIAGEHHETIDGTGYPKRLSKEDLSIPSRIMAIADIFEALTASDRPYKKAKTLSEALKIMYIMKKEKHIDADLFDLFITSGVYITYAKNYLHPEQIDGVDETKLLG